MKILKLKLFQETACYKKPFSFKVSETYPLPPYSTVIGMFHKIIEAKNGEYFDMNISIQGNYEGIFSNFQNLIMFKKKEKGVYPITTMPRNVHQLLNVNSVIHMQAEDSIVDKIYSNIVNGKTTFTLGRNEDIVRVDEVKLINTTVEVNDEFINKYNAYVPLKYTDRYVRGINYRLNTTYKIEDDLRKWKKIDVKFVEKGTNQSIPNGLKDEDDDFIFWYK